MTYYAGVYNWAVTFSGQTALRYVDEDGQPGGPSLTFRDPTFDIMSDARRSHSGPLYMPPWIRS
jgi:hypothetical protein